MQLMDCHCHIDMAGVLNNPQDFYQAITSDPRLNVKSFFNIMSTNHLDLAFLEKVLELDEHHVVVPYFGIHPWYAHLFSLEENVKKSDHYKSVILNLTDELIQVLPEPIFLRTYMEKLKALAQKCEDEGRLYGIGEIGLDKVIRIPTNGYYGNPFSLADGVSLTSAKTLMDHQTKIFVSGLRLAEELKKPVSLHCVKAHGTFFDILSASFLDIPKLALHSYTGSKDQAKRWLLVTLKQSRKLYFSFSEIINGIPEKETGFSDMMELLANEQLLIETDMAVDRYFLGGSEGKYFKALESVKSKLASYRGWSEQEADTHLQDNYAKFHES